MSPTKSHTFEVRIEPEMTRRAWNAWFFQGRRLGRLGFAYLLLLAPTGVDVWRGRFGALSVMSATVFGMTLLIYSAVYVVGLRRALAKRDLFKDGKACYTLTEEKIAVSSSLGSSTVAWSLISEVRCYPDLLLLGFGGAGFSTLPVSQMPEDALVFLLERARAGGAKIIHI